MTTLNSWKVPLSYNRSCKATNTNALREEAQHWCPQPTRLLPVSKGNTRDDQSNQTRYSKTKFNAPLSPRFLCHFVNATEEVCFTQTLRATIKTSTDFHSPSDPPPPPHHHHPHSFPSPQVRSNRDQRLQRIKYSPRCPSSSVQPVLKGSWGPKIIFPRQCFLCI